MAIPITCGGCGTTFRVKDSAQGRKVRCKFCGEAVDVPVGGQLHSDRSTQLPARASGAKRKLSARKKTTGSTDGPPIALLIGGGLFALVLFAVGGFFVVRAVLQGPAADPGGVGIDVAQAPESPEGISSVDTQSDSPTDTIDGGNLGAGTIRHSFTIETGSVGMYLPATEQYFSTTKDKLSVLDVRTGELLQVDCPRQVREKSTPRIHVNRNGERVVRIVEAVSADRKRGTDIVAELWQLEAEPHLVGEIVLGRALSEFANFDGFGEGQFDNILFLFGGVGNATRFMMDVESGTARKLVPAYGVLRGDDDYFPHSEVYVGECTGSGIPGPTAGPHTSIFAAAHEGVYSLQGYFHAAAASGHIVALSVREEVEHIKKSESILLLDISEFPYKTLWKIATPQPLHRGCLQLSPNGQYLVAYCGDSLCLFDVSGQELVSQQKWDPSKWMPWGVIPGVNFVFSVYGNHYCRLTNDGDFVFWYHTNIRDADQQTMTVLEWKLLAQ